MSFSGPGNRNLVEHRFALLRGRGACGIYNCKRAKAHTQHTHTQEPPDAAAPARTQVTPSTRGGIKLNGERREWPQGQCRRRVLHVSGKLTPKSLGEPDESRKRRGGAMGGISGGFGGGVVGGGEEGRR